MTVTVVVLFLAKELKFVSYPEASREIPKKVSMNGFLMWNTYYASCFRIGILLRMRLKI